jgi:hypothetical protein
LRDLWINYRLLNEWQLQFGQFVVLSGLPRSVAGPRRLLTELRIAENGFSLAHANRNALRDRTLGNSTGTKRGDRFGTWTSHTINAGWTRVSAGTSQSSRDPDPALAGLRLLPR